MTEEPPLFPATYRSSFAKQLKPLSYAVVIFALGMLGRAHLDLSSSILVWILFFLGLGLTPLLAFGTARSRITLYDDRIEKRTWSGTQTWRREDVARIWQRSSGGFWLAHRQNSGYYFTVPAGIERDAAWDAWLADVPTMDHLTRQVKVDSFFVVFLFFSFGSFFICMLLFFVAWGGEVRQRAAADYAHTQAKVE